MSSRDALTQTHALLEALKVSVFPRALAAAPALCHRVTVLEVMMCSAALLLRAQLLRYIPILQQYFILGETADISFLTNKCFILFVGKWYMCPDFQVL